MDDRFVYNLYLFLIWFPVLVVAVFALDFAVAVIQDIVDTVFRRK